MTELNIGSNTYRYRIENTNGEVIDETVTFNFSQSFQLLSCFSLLGLMVEFYKKLALKIYPIFYSYPNAAFKITLTDVKKEFFLQLKAFVGDVKYNNENRANINVASLNFSNNPTGNNVYSYTLNRLKTDVNVQAESYQSSYKSSTSIRLPNLYNVGKIDGNVAFEVFNKLFKVSANIAEVKEVIWVQNKIVNEEYYEYFNGSWSF